MKCSTVVKHCCFCVDHAEGVKVLAILSLFECVGFAIASGVYAERNYSKSVGLFSLLIFLIIFFVFLFAGCQRIPTLSLQGSNFHIRFKRSRNSAPSGKSHSGQRD
ncbi:hypothetical protein TCAL_15587 [Tigriopus californicus]|uniref:Uncharacterized protein n=1 Tax=Tigriopus californicus TaxID=6832 RepID=A0A553PDP3_TIGCA|nr:hypothetical protein TCAL_15587 [Tigriopus californicus]